MVERKNFGKLKAVIEPPDLITIQTQSYTDFLQMGKESAERDVLGLEALFAEVFPIESYDGRYVLDYVKYKLSEPKLDRVESLYEGLTYAAPLHVSFRLKDGEEVGEEEQ